MSAPTMSANRGHPPVAPVRRRRRRVRVWQAMLAFLIAAPLMAGWQVVSAAHASDMQTSDAIVVLGAAQYNGKPSPVLRARLQHAETLRQEGVSAQIVTVGGKLPTDRFTEAEAGQQYLLERGVDSAVITAVPVGSNTHSSLQAVAEVAQQRGWQTITLVSDPAHMARAAAIADALGFEVRMNPTTTGDGTTLTAQYVARESAGLLLFETIQRWLTPQMVT